VPEPAELLALAKANPGRVVAAIWAVHFLLTATELINYRGETIVSLVLAFSAVGLLLANQPKGPQ